MLSEILKTIVQLKSIEENNPEVKVIIKQLEESVYNKVSKNILDIISIGEYIGYHEIDQRLRRASDYITQMRIEKEKGEEDNS